MRSRLSDAPSYHSSIHYTDSAPAYAPRAGPAPRATRPATASPTRPQTIGLPPVPPLPPQSFVALQHFRLPTWSANNAPAARHYRNVAERRITDGRYGASDAPLRRYATADHLSGHDQPLPPASPLLRPLEDPYLVGEVAAAQARSQRLARESGDDILIREDRQWDWMLAHMKDWDKQPRSWPTKFRRDVDTGHRKKLLHRIGGRLLS
ncbi:hypothetical protein CDD83_11250 [Cordyceps sp. RAO-2017]|nr:hypothetical protein CDD83_11250 [Cordyceps sp. RAO-2017]